MLLAAFLLAGLLPTMLITGLAFYEARGALKDEIKIDMQTHATAAAAEIDRMMFERLQNVASWSRLEIMQDLRIGDVDKRLSKFLGELKSSYRGVYTELYVVNASGIIIASSNPKQLGLLIFESPQVEPHEWLHVALPQGDIQVLSLIDDRLPISAEIIDPIESGSIGKLVAVFDWKQIQRVLQSAVAGGGSAALFDAQNGMLAMTRGWPETQASRKFKASSIAKGYEDFPGLSWRVAIAQHRAVALAPIRRMGLIFIGLLIATVLLATLIAIPVATSITRPLAKLTGFASGFIRAPSNMPPPPGGPAEVQALSKAFGKMIEDLEHSKENLTRAAKLAVVGEMAAAMSHEVRTPLGILRSSAQVLLREPSLSEEGREVCGFIISETERLNRLVSTLIDSARPRTIEFIVTDIAELAQQTTSMLRIQAQKKNITLDCETSAPALAACDAEQITQVLLNLLLNAIQILPEGGRILMRVYQTAEHVIVTVADNGPGVPAEQREQIFDPFFTQRSGGIGLGLAVVRQIVMAHHGEITVGTNNEMKGAEFRLQLPVSGVQI